MTTELQEKTTAPFGSLVTPSGGPAWLADLRTRARNAFERQGIPTTKHEEWKYTSLRPIAEGFFAMATPSTVRHEDLDEATYVADAIRLVFVDGRLAVGLSSPTPAGLAVTTLANDPQSFEGRLGELIDLDRHPFGALNTAHFEDAILIRIAKGRLELPIELVFASTGSAGSVCLPRLVIVAEDEAEATISETYVTVGAGGLTCPVIETFVAPNAILEHIKVQRESTKAFHIAVHQVRQERDSTYRHFSVTYGGRLTRNDLEVFLNGSNLHCRMDGVYVQNGEQVCDNHTRLDHAFPHCDSFEVYKGVLDGHARGVFNGKIFVHQDAQKTDAKQTNQAILLSPTASIDTKPQLEIFADDVKCTHGATVGQLRDDALFYLRSRGIPRADATALLVYAFAAEVLEKIENETIREVLERLLYEKLAQVS